MFELKEKKFILFFLNKQENHGHKCWIYATNEKKYSLSLSDEGS